MINSFSALVVYGRHQTTQGLGWDGGVIIWDHCKGDVKRISVMLHRQLIKRSISPRNPPPGPPARAVIVPPHLWIMRPSGSRIDVDISDALLSAARTRTPQTSTQHSVSDERGRTGKSKETIRPDQVGGVWFKQAMRISQIRFTSGNTPGSIAVFS